MQARWEAIVVDFAATVRILYNEDRIIGVIIEPLEEDDPDDGERLHVVSETADAAAR